MSYKLVIITQDGPEHRFVANRICTEFDVASILVTESAPRRPWKGVLRKNGFRRFIDKAIWRVFLRLMRDNQSRGAEIDRILGPQSRNFEEPGKVVRVGQPKQRQLLREVKRIAPDFIAIYGTGIIPDSVLKQASKRAFNMHTGMSPEYRGAAGAFWPIVDRRPDLVGATVHRCTADIDGGEIYFRGSAQLFADDTLHSVFARAVLVGSVGYLDVLGRAIEGRLEGTVQDRTQGRIYSGVSRGLTAEVLGRFRLLRMRRTWAAPQDKSRR